jgi:hypothetical protein
MLPIDASRKILLLALVLLIPLAGTWLVLSTAHAAILSAALPTLNPGPTPSVTDDSSILAPEATPVRSSGPLATAVLAPAPTPTPVVTTTDMTGIIGLAILVVIVTLVGMVWGGAPSRRKGSTKK